MSIIPWIKEHPYETAGAVFAVGLVGIIVINLGKAGGSTSGQAAATDDSAEIAAEEQAAQTASQTQASELAANLQLQEEEIGASAGTIAAGYTLAATVNTNQTASQINAQNVEGSVQNTSTEADASVAETDALASAQLQTALGADSANIQIGEANDATQDLISQYSNQALEVESNNLAAVGITQANDSASIAKTASGDAETAGIISSIAGIL